jgi:ABC-2 type transport system ATP-binding protein
MEDIEQVSERVIIINQGKLVYDDSLEMLKRTFSTKKYIKIILSEKIGSQDIDSKFAKFGIILEKRHDSLIIEIEKSNQAKAISDIINMEKVLDIDIEGIPLNKIIESIFKKKVDN